MVLRINVVALLNTIVSDHVSFHIVIPFVSHERGINYFY